MSNQKLSLGHTAITCKHCKAITAVANEALEAMREHKCPACGMRMTDYELARLKLHYYLLWVQMFKERWGDLTELFDYDIHIWPHYEPKETEENGNREGEFTSENK